MHIYIYIQKLNTMYLRITYAIFFIIIFVESGFDVVVESLVESSSGN